MVTMDWLPAAFRDNMNLEHHLSAKIFLFMLKAVSATAYIFVLGYIAAGGAVDAAIHVVLLVGAVFDLIPDAATMQLIHDLPQTAQRAEYLQITLTVLAYLILVTTLFIAAPFGLFTGYAAFATLWIAGFLVQESVLLFTETV